MVFKEINVNSKALILSHADLDGVSSAFLARQHITRQYGGNYSVYCHMSPVAGVTSKMLDDLFIVVNPYMVKEIYILDRASDIDTITKASDYFPDATIKIIDHHISQKSFYESLKDKPNIELYVDYTTSATKIMQSFFTNSDVFESFSTIVDLWDTFKWRECKSQYISKLALMLNAYLYMLGAETTYKVFNEHADMLLTGEIILLPGFDLLYNAYKIKLDNEIKRIKEKMVLLKYDEKFSQDGMLKNNIKRYCVIGYVPYEVDAGLISMAFNQILDSDPIDNEVLPSLIFSISNEGTFSVRSSMDSPLSALEFVKLIDPNGGGHPQASGGNISIPFAHRDLLTEVFLHSKTLNKPEIKISNYYSKESGENYLIRKDISEVLERFLSKTDIEILTKE